jgi:hypothetical protein
MHPVHTPCVSLNITCGAGPWTPYPPEPYHLPLLFFFCLSHWERVPQGQNLIPYPLVRITSCWPEFSTEKNKSKMERNSNGDGILQIIYRWKDLTEENSLKQLISKMEHCTSLALKEKEIGCEVQLGNLGSNWTNWQFSPTIQLGPLLVSISYYFHNFLNEMGARDHELSLTVSMNWRLRRENWD